MIMRRLLSVGAVFLTSIAAPALAAPCAGFTDVDSASPFCTNVTWLKSRSVTLGCTATLYCPNDPVTRLAMAVFMNRLGDALLPPAVTWVANTGGTFQSLQAAIDAAKVTATQASPALVKVAPGTYTGPITMQPWVDVEGSGEGVTTITSSTCSAFPPGAGTVVLASNAQLRNVTVVNTGAGSTHCAAVVANGAVPRPIENVTASATGATTAGGGNYGVYAQYGPSQRPTLRNLTLSATGGVFSFGLYGTSVTPSGTVTLERINASATTSGGAGANASALWLDGAFDLRDIVARAAGATVSSTYNSAIWFNGGVFTGARIDAAVTAGASAYNLVLNAPTGAGGISVSLRDVVAAVAGTGFWNIAAYNGNSTMDIVDSKLSAAGGTSLNYAAVASVSGTTRIATSQLVTPGAVATGTVSCLYTYGGSLAPVTC